MSNGKTEVRLPLTNQRFNTTHWTVVLTAKRSGSPDAAEALEHLCSTYWGALYAFARRQGRSSADAADLTQAFFARFLEKEFLKDVDREKGKFRSFLLKALNHFLADEWRHAHAQKRAGSHPVVSIDTDDWEARFGHELAYDTTPEKLFERRWAMTLFEQALTRLRNEAVGTGKSREFDLLKEFLSSPSSDGVYAIAAGTLGVSEGAVAVQVHRLRKRYGQLVREAVARTVASADEVEEELRHLLDVLGD
jgi:RNA polymerase sigma-70 factor (ECF subfamily)